MMTTLQAKDYLDPRGLIIESAARLADEIGARLGAGQDVEVVLAGIKGIPSSYFNVILQRVAEHFGADAIAHRVSFRFDTEVQRQVYGRSLAAVTKAISP